MSEISLDRAKAAKKEALRRFRKLASVTGIGVTRVGGQYAIKINVNGAVRVAFPPDINGVPIRVEVTGPLKTR